MPLLPTTPIGPPYVQPVRSADATDDELPELYARGLQLRRAGLGDTAIAARLGIEPEAVPALLRLAAAKRARALSRPTAIGLNQPEPRHTSTRQEHAMTAHDLEQLARESIDAFNDDAWTRLRELITDDYVYEETGTGRVTRGGDELVAALQAWKASVPDCRGEVLRVLTDGTTIAVEVLWSGTQTGPMDLGGNDFPASGRPFRCFATMWTRWEGGRAAEERHHMDMLGMLAQIGALPAPSAARSG